MWLSSSVGKALCWSTRGRGFDPRHRQIRFYFFFNGSCCENEALHAIRGLQEARCNPNTRSSRPQTRTEHVQTSDETRHLGPKTPVENSGLKRDREPRKSLVTTKKRVFAPFWSKTRSKTHFYDKREEQPAPLILQRYIQNRKNLFKIRSNKLQIWKKNDWYNQAMIPIVSPQICLCIYQIQLMVPNPNQLDDFRSE